MTHDEVLPEFLRTGSRRGFSILLEITRRYDRWSHRRRVFSETYNELSICSDRDLSDIGIARCNIPFIAAEAARVADEEQSR